MVLLGTGPLVQKISDKHVIPASSWLDPVSYLTSALTGQIVRAVIRIQRSVVRLRGVLAGYFCDCC